MKEKIQTKFNEAKEQVTEKADSIKEKVEDSWEAVKESTRTKWEEVKETTLEKWEGLKSTLESRVDDWREIGGNLVNGLREGIRNVWEGAQGLASWVGEKASALTQTVRSVFDENSPSKVWMEIGEFLGIGLQEGLKASADDVEKETVRLANSVNDAMDLESRFNDAGMINSLDNVLDRLSQIADLFSDITGVLNNTSVPAIATGRVVPQQMAFTGNAANTDSLVQAMTEVLQNANTNGMLGGRDNGDIVLNIDGRELFRFVRDRDKEYFNRMGRMVKEEYRLEHLWSAAINKVNTLINIY